MAPEHTGGRVLAPVLCPTAGSGAGGTAGPSPSVAAMMIQGLRASHPKSLNFAPSWWLQEGEIPTGAGRCLCAAAQGP